MKNLTARRLSLILLGALGLLVCVLVGGSAFAASTLIGQSKDATRASIDADISAGATGRLELLKQYLATHATGIAQTRDLTRKLGTYDQNTVIATISGYAGKSGVSITGFDFGTRAAGAAGTAAPAGAGSTVNLTLASPVRYTNVITFFKLLEQGLMPAQIVAGSVNPAGDDPSMVSVDQLSIKVVQ